MMNLMREKNLFRPLSGVFKNARQISLIRVFLALQERSLKAHKTLRPAKHCAQLSSVNFTGLANVESVCCIVGD